MANSLDVDGLDSSEILKVLKDFEIEDRNDAVSSIMISVLCDIATALETIKIELKKMREAKEKIADG